MTKPYNWKIFWILSAAATIGLLAIIPYSLALSGGAVPANLPMPLPLLMTIQIGSQVLMFVVAVAIGLFFANRSGLGLPILEAGLRGEPVGERLRRILPLSIILGIVASVAIIALDAYVFGPAVRAQFGDAAVKLTQRTAAPAAWKGFLASFYGGIDEEILLRLLVMSFLAWLGRFVSRKADGTPTSAVYWVANVLAAVLFGLGHLPATSLLVPALTPLVILRAIVLNGLAGVVFGSLYFTRGLESAMISHFSADIVLHVLFRL